MFRSLYDGLERARAEGTITTAQMDRILRLAESRSSWVTQTTSLIGLLLVTGGLLLTWANLYRLLSAWSIVVLYWLAGAAALWGVEVFARRGGRAACFVCAAAATLFIPLALQGLWTLLIGSAPVDSVKRLFGYLGLWNADSLSTRLALCLLALGTAGGLTVRTDEPLMAGLTVAALWQTALTAWTMAAGPGRALGVVTAVFGLIVALAAAWGKRDTARFSTRRLMDGTLLSGCVLLWGGVFWRWGPGDFPAVSLSLLAFNLFFAFAMARLTDAMPLVMLGGVGALFALYSLGDHYLSEPYDSLAVLAVGGLFLLWAVGAHRGRSASPPPNGRSD